MWANFVAQYIVPRISPFQQLFQFTFQKRRSKMASPIDEEDLSYYQNFNLNDHDRTTQYDSPRHRRGDSQPVGHGFLLVDSPSNSIRNLGSGHRRIVSQPVGYRAYDMDVSDTPTNYMTASDRRRSAHPAIYKHDTPQRRSGVLRAIFTPRPSEIDDLEQHHSCVYTMLHPRSGVWYAEVFKKFISTLIIADLIAFVISTEERIYVKYWVWFQAIEGVTTSIFLVEYIARVSVCVENKKFGDRGPVLGRLWWMVSFHAIIDVMATAPFFIQLLTGFDMPTLTYLRIFRVLKIMKTDGYARAFSACYRVVYFNREILSVALLICFFLVVISSVLLYYCRPREGDDGVGFQSIPSTLYLSVLILTGQDSFIRSSEEMPWYTKVVVGLTGALSVAMYAIPVSLLTWGFEAEAERCARKTRADIKQANKSMVDVAAERANSMNSDDEYLRIIAKDTSESTEVDDDKNMEKIKEMTSAYMKDDREGKKYFALADFLANTGHRAEPPYVPTTLVDTEPLSNDIANLQHRMQNLESSVATIHSKLDKLCELLEGNDDIQRIV